jgi:hypothetical protein
MDAEARWNRLVALDEELLQGGVILSEWCSFIVCEADTAFANGADLASLLTAVAAIETYLRSEYGAQRKEPLVDLIERAPIPADLKTDLSRLRKYRNHWVHVDAPWDDGELLEHPEVMRRELEEMAFFAAERSAVPSTRIHGFDRGQSIATKPSGSPLASDR